MESCRDNVAESEGGLMYCDEPGTEPGWGNGEWARKQEDVNEEQRRGWQGGCVRGRAIQKEENKIHDNNVGI